MRHAPLLGWLLLAGGVAYVLGAFLAYLAPGAQPVAADLLRIPATIGEFWMIGYLLHGGVFGRGSNGALDIGRTAA